MLCAGVVLLQEEILINNSITVYEPTYEGFGISCDEYSEVPVVSTPLCDKMRRLQDRFEDSFITINDLRSVFGDRIPARTYDSLLRVPEHILQALEDSSASKFTHYVFPDPGLSAHDMWILLTDRSANREFLETCDKFGSFNRPDVPTWRILPKHKFLSNGKQLPLRQLFLGMHLHYLATGEAIDGTYPLFEQTDIHAFTVKYTDGRLYLITNERKSIVRKH